jgi:hypothetical protein
VYVTLLSGKNRQCALVLASSARAISVALVMIHLWEERSLVPQRTSILLSVSRTPGMTTTLRL